jgi:hypothetical protein
MLSGPGLLLVKKKKSLSIRSKLGSLHLHGWRDACSVCFNYGIDAFMHACGPKTARSCRCFRFHMLLLPRSRNATSYHRSRHHLGRTAWRHTAAGTRRRPGAPIAPPYRYRGNTRRHKRGKGSHVPYLSASYPHSVSKPTSTIYKHVAVTDASYTLMGRPPLPPAGPKCQAPVQVQPPLPPPHALVAAR